MDRYNNVGGHGAEAGGHGAGVGARGGAIAAEAGARGAGSDGRQSPSVKSKRELALERLRKRYPNKSFDDDEAMYAQILDDYDSGAQELAGYRDREKTFSDLFTSDPRSAQFLTDWKNGKNPAVALVEMFGDDFVEELKDPEKQEELAKASKDFAERVAKEREYEDEYTKNIDESREMIEQLQQEEGLSDDDIDRAMEFLVGIMKDGILGKFSKESVLMALNALDHDADVAAAEEEGRVAGRNAKIDERLRQRVRNDGTANLAGKNGVGSRQPLRRPSIFALAEEAL